jgi:hypothetical protein
MARPIKFTDQNKEWYFRRNHCRELLFETREERQRILIVCEGTETEPNYFKSIRSELPPNVVDVEITGTGNNTKSLLERSINIKEKLETNNHPFDQVWIVFDFDSFPAHNFDNTIKSAIARGVKCAWSNEAFEIWYILHFEYRNTGMRRTEYKEKLTVLLGEDYLKNDQNMYYKLKQNGDQNKAASWAKMLLKDFTERKVSHSQSNPCTTVFLLVQELNRFKVISDD